VTRERPRFARYAKLLVSSLAGAAALGAAYRFLVRRPDPNAVPARAAVPTSSGESVETPWAPPQAAQAEPAAVDAVAVAEAEQTPLEAAPVEPVAVVEAEPEPPVVAEAVAEPEPPVVAEAEPTAAGGAAPENELEPEPAAPPPIFAQAAAPLLVETVHTARPRTARITSRSAIAAAVGGVLLLAIVFALQRPPGESAVAGLTPGPTSAPPSLVVVAASPSASAILTASSASLIPTLGPVLTQAPPATPATVRSTPRPAANPTPRPTPTPTPYCTVPKLIGVETNRAKGIWSNAGFTGQVTFSPAVPPHYTITSQSRAAGSKATCTSGITVQGTP
jgi:hypothetical protein